MIIPLNKLELLEQRVTSALEIISKLKEENEKLNVEIKILRAEIDNNKKQYKGEQSEVEELKNKNNELVENQEMLKIRIEKLIEQLDKFEMQQPEDASDAEDTSNMESNEESNSGESNSGELIQEVGQQEMSFSDTDMVQDEVPENLIDDDIPGEAVANSEDLL